MPITGGVFTYIAIVAAALVAGIIQTVTGFGAAVLLMLVMPYFFNMITAPAVTSAITLGFTVTLAWKFRKHIDLKACLFPTLIYQLCSIASIGLAKELNLEHLSVAFGIFLIILAIYFFVFSEKITVQANRKTAAVCALISGITAGFFGIGGPLMAIYFISATEDKQSYIGTLQFLFAFTNIVNMMMRIANGIFTVDLLPVVLLGFVGITVGKLVGLRILDKTNPDRIKKLVYAFVGISGVLSLI